MNRKDLTFEEERLKFARMKALLFPHLALPVVECIIRVRVSNIATGEVVSELARYSHSLTRNWWNSFFAMAVGTKSGTIGSYADGEIGWKNWSGSVTSSPLPSAGGGSAEQSDGYYSAAGNDATGILIGTDNTAESIDDFQIIAQIADGTGAGEMEHGECTVFEEGWKENSYYSIWDRSFDNGSSGSITVNEIAIYYKRFSSSIYYCNARDLISGGQAVGVGERLTCRYEIRCSYTAASSSSSSSSFSSSSFSSSSSSFSSSSSSFSSSSFSSSSSSFSSSSFSSSSSSTST